MRHIVCFGNPLHGDDGFGPAVYRAMQDQVLPPDVRLFEAGTRGFDALTLFETCELAIVVDALAPADCPGRVLELQSNEIDAEPELPGHGAGVGSLLRALEALGTQPATLRILVAEAAEIVPFRPRLSPPMERAVDEAVTRLHAWLEDH